MEDARALRAARHVASLGAALRAASPWLLSALGWVVIMAALLALLPGLQDTGPSLEVVAVVLLALASVPLVEGLVIGAPALGEALEARAEAMEIRVAVRWQMRVSDGAALRTWDGASRTNSGWPHDFNASHWRRIGAGEMRAEGEYLYRLACSESLQRLAVEAGR